MLFPDKLPTKQLISFGIGRTDEFPKDLKMRLFHPYRRMALLTL